MTDWSHPKRVQLVHPAPIAGYIEHRGLLVPHYYDEAYRHSLLSDYGLRDALTHESLFGRPWPIPDVASVLSTQDPLFVLMLGIQLSRHVSNAGVERLDQPDQQRVTKAAIEDGKRVGLTADTSLSLDRAAFGPETAHALVVTGLWLLNRARRAGDALTEQDFPRAARACLALNDQIYAPLDYPEGSDDFHLENLRSVWIRSPLQCMPFFIGLRGERISELARNTLARLKSPLRTKYEGWFRKSYGTSVEEFITLTGGFLTTLISSDRKHLPALKIPDIENHSSATAVRLLRSLSLPLEKHGEFLGTMSLSDALDSAQVIAELVRRPFIEWNPGEFVLLSPAFLMRCVEWALDTAFFENKGAEDIRLLRGPLGVEAERYARKRIKQAWQRFPAAPKLECWEDTGTEGPGDLILINDAVALVFEIKNRLPRKDALIKTEDGHARFKEWFEENYLAPPPRAGALHQLASYVKRVLAGEVLGIHPRAVLPVIVNPQALLFAYDFYELIQRHSSQIPAFEPPDVYPLLVLGVEELDLLTCLDYAGAQSSFATLLLTKARHDAAKLTAWGTVIERTRLKQGPPLWAEDKTTARDVMKILRRDGIEIRVSMPERQKA